MAIFWFTRKPENRHYLSRFHVVTFLAHSILAAVFCDIAKTREKHGKCPRLKQCRVPLDIQKFSIFEGQKLTLILKKITF